MRRLILLALALGALAASETIPIVLPRGARLALCGDSITEQMLYTRYVEAYLLACAGRGDVSVFQFGWAGEDAGQFGHRVDRGDLDAFRPTAVVLAYGANDAGGEGWQPWMEAMWNGRMGGMLDRLAQRHPATAAATVICSPTWFQAAADGGDGARIAAANAVLERFRAMDLAIARARPCGFADAQERLRRSGEAAVAALGPGYRYAGRDGVHPGPNGHLAIAHEVLRALGCDGAIATITVDLAGGATASAGHTVVGATGGAVTIASTRYPFCLGTSGTAPADGLATILPWLPFTRDLDRFTLVVRRLDAAGAGITWGDETRAFSREQLAAGVNLAAEFAHTPFDGDFARLMALIAIRQAKERDMIKAAGDALAPRAGWTAADVAARDALDAEVHAAVVPVRHVIRVTPIP